MITQEQKDEMESLVLEDYVRHLGKVVVVTRARHVDCSDELTVLREMDLRGIGIKARVMLTSPKALFCWEGDILFPQWRVMYIASRALYGLTRKLDTRLNAPYYKLDGGGAGWFEYPPTLSNVARNVAWQVFVGMRRTAGRLGRWVSRKHV